MIFLNNGHFNTDYEVLKTIRNNGFETVCLAKNKIDNLDYTVTKLAVKNNIPSRELLLQRFNKISQIKDEGVISYEKSWWEIPDSWDFEEDALSAGEEESEDDNAASKNTGPYLNCYIVTEFFSEYTLENWLKENTSLQSRSSVSVFISDLLNALGYIHEKGVIHGNLNPRSIFVKFSDPERTWAKLKIGDFSFASRVPTQSMYLAPKQTPGENISQAGDYFALGLIGIELIHPMASDEEKKAVFDKRRHGDLLSSILKESERTSKLILAMTSEHPEHRKEAVTMLNSSF